MRHLSTKVRNLEESQTLLLTRSAAGIVEHLLEHHGVALVPGDAFGAPGHVRLSFAASMADLEKGMDRLLRGLQEFQ